MTQLKNSRLLKAIWREPLDATPIWIMRQAGRYLPEYRALRAKAGSFLNLCKTPDLACEITMQPLKRFDLDAAILFSDILTIPDALGLGLEFEDGKGPMFSKPIRHENDISNIPRLDISQLDYVYQTIRLLTKELNNRLPLIGFCGSPFTLAMYMIEGRSNPGFPLASSFLQKNPLLFQTLLDKLAIAVTQHLNEQIKAGVSVVMIFDTWGGLLDQDQYELFSLNYIKKIINTLLRSYNSSKIPVILYTKGAVASLEQMADSGSDVIGLNEEISLQQARLRIGKKVILQGNMPPTFLLESPASITEKTSQILADFGSGSGHIFNLSHGITQQTPPENVAILVDTVHELSEAYHRHRV